MRASCWLLLLCSCFFAHLIKDISALLCGEPVSHVKSLFVYNQTFPAFLVVFFPSNLTVDGKFCRGCYYRDTVVKQHKQDQHFIEVTGSPLAPLLRGARVTASVLGAGLGERRGAEAGQAAGGRVPGV